MNGRILEYSGEDLLKTWFPYSDIQITTEQSSDVQRRDLADLITNYLRDNDHINATFTKEGKQILLDSLNSLLEKNRIAYNYSSLGIHLPVQQLNKILKLAGYRMEDAPGVRKGTSFYLAEIE